MKTLDFDVVMLVMLIALVCKCWILTSASVCGVDFVRMSLISVPLRRILDADLMLEKLSENYFQIEFYFVSLWLINYT